MGTDSPFSFRTMNCSIGTASASTCPTPTYPYRQECYPPGLLDWHSKGLTVKRPPPPPINPYQQPHPISMLSAKEQ